MPILAMLPLVLLLPIPAVPNLPMPLPAAQVQATERSSTMRASDRQPMRVQLMTVVDHGPELAGHLVELPPARVKRIIDGTLFVIADPHGHGNYHGYRPTRWDQVLVWLPTTAGLSRGEHVVVVGTIRTVRGARLSGELAGATDEFLKRYGNAPLLVADRVETPDGENILPRR